MKKREIVQQVAELSAAVTVAKARLGDADLAVMASKLDWLHERVDLLFARCEAMRGDITLDDAAAQRLTFAVGQFSARLDRLEQPPKPRGRPRKQRPQMPAGPNGEAERTQPPATTTDPTGEPKP
jgi:hypothetical protein